MNKATASFTLGNVRQQFPALAAKTFLDAACVSLTPLVAAEAIQNFLEMATLCPSASSTLHHIAMDEMRAAARPAAARLIHAHEDEIALVESTSHGLAIAAQAIPFRSGDRVLLCDLEFMQVAIPWLQLQQHGVAVELVPHQSGGITAEQIAARLTPATRAIVISSTQWTNGFRCDLAAISQMCRDRNVWLVVDAIQQLGAFPIDVQQTPVDFLACGGHKWLNAPFGCGFLYIRKERMQELNSPMAGYLSLQSPEGGWGNYFQTPSITPVSDYKFVCEGRVYEAGGTANYPGAIGLAASLGLIEQLGQDAISQHIRSLTDQLISGLQSLNVQVVTPLTPANRSGIVSFSVGEASANIALMEFLLARKILVSVRYTSQVGGVRVSSHFYNHAADIDRLLAAVGEYRKG